MWWSRNITKISVFPLLPIRHFPNISSVGCVGVLDSGSWFNHVAGWWARRNDPNVLILRYEDLQRGPTGTIRRIAAFCNIPLSNERLARVLERSSFAFMKRYEDKIDPMPFMSKEIGVTP
jgi:hypothetical protein